MSRNLRTRIAFGLALASACVTPGIDREALPEAPIAFVFYTPEQGRTLAEARELGVEPQSLRVEADNPASGALEGKLARFHLRADELRGQLVLLDPRSGETTRVEAAPRGAWPLDWSPGHERLLFAATQDDDAAQLFSLEGGVVLPLTSGPSSHPSGAFGPGRNLVFSRLVSDPRRGLSENIWIDLAERGGEQSISAGPYDRDPVWSPDGSRIVFVTRLPDKSPGLLAVEGGTSTAEPVFRFLGRGSDPVFTPDGEWIVYSHPTHEGKRIWRMRPDGSGKLPIGRGVGDEEQPTVSPDGRFVAFVVREGGRHSLFVRSLDGSTSRLLFDGGDGVRPVW
jgi:Tol biopolymer transport system component